MLRTRRGEVNRLYFGGFDGLGVDWWCFTVVV